MNQQAMDGFLSNLWSAPTAEMPLVFDPWNARADDDVGEKPIEDRRARLRKHLFAPRPKLLCVGEAPGYQGCRLSGIGFTSERLLLEGAIPRIERLDSPLSVRDKPWSEQSATIVWGALYKAGLAEDTILWNAFPWHPHSEGDRLSNRAPSHVERRAGLVHLQSLVRALPGVLVVAVGKHAQQSLQDIGVTAPVLRHPANGGAAIFRAQLELIAADLCAAVVA